MTTKIEYETIQGKIEKLEEFTDTEITENDESLSYNLIDTTGLKGLDSSYQYIFCQYFGRCDNSRDFLKYSVDNNYDLQKVNSDEDEILRNYEDEEGVYYMEQNSTHLIISKIPGEVYKETWKTSADTPSGRISLKNFPVLTSEEDGIDLCIRNDNLTGEQDATLNVLEACVFEATGRNLFGDKKINPVLEYNPNVMSVWEYHDTLRRTFKFLEEQRNKPIILLGRVMDEYAENREYSSSDLIAECNDYFVELDKNRLEWNNE